MRDRGLQGARRGKKLRTTIRDDGHERAGDLLRRDFTVSRPNQRWVADFTYVATWSGIGMIGRGSLFWQTLCLSVTPP
jgi:putative transposase